MRSGLKTGRRTNQDLPLRLHGGIVTEQRRETLLLKLGRLPFIGDWVATIVGLWPIVLFALLVDMESAYGVWWWLVLSGMLLAPWLIILQRWQGVSINTPYLPIKWLWLTPIFIFLGIAGFLGWME
jgi:hypothetical protein